MFEQVYSSQSAMAEDVLKMISSDGPLWAIELLKAYHYPGEHECSDDTSSSSDTRFEMNNYILSYSEQAGYINLQYQCEHDLQPSQQVVWEYQLLRDMVDRVLCIDYELSENMRILDDLMNLEELDLKDWLTMNDEAEFEFMVPSARKVISSIYQYFDDKGDFTTPEEIILCVKMELNHEPD
jgi:hypothetical protein